MGITRIFGVVVTIVITLFSVQVTAQIIEEAQEAMRCVTKLLPCGPYIHLSIPPPPWCCTPMKEIAENNSTCLCAAFNHPEMLRFIALTKESALNLLSSCGVPYDLSLCTTNPSSPSALPEAASNGSTKRNAAALGISVLGNSFVSAVLGMIFF
ncbi:lipid transfer-like protein VAS [Capsella rubella]|uniref:lipid transfer-like protein VAS n=1 Tax=Capsella rubella TaxID=81985 RepID=UPI000CD59EF8|nr:lipid transfer-like protein VAS [Capsella rubella]